MYIYIFIELNKHAVKTIKVVSFLILFSCIALELALSCSNPAVKYERFENTFKYVSLNGYLVKKSAKT